MNFHFIYIFFLFDKNKSKISRNNFLINFTLDVNFKSYVTRKIDTFLFFISLFQNSTVDSLSLMMFSEKRSAIKRSVPAY